MQPQHSTHGHTHDCEALFGYSDCTCRHVPSTTPHLDSLRPVLLRALHVRGWTTIPNQHAGVFTLRASRNHAGAVLRFRETADGVTYEHEGSGADLALRDLAAEGLGVRR